MTWTVFEHLDGPNPTARDAPGRGGCKYVVANAGKRLLATLAEERYGVNPLEADNWSVTEYETADEAREACGEIEVEAGGIGNPMTRARTMEELHGSLDTWVLQEQAIREAADEHLPAEAAERAREAVESGKDLPPSAADEAAENGAHAEGKGA